MDEDNKLPTIMECTASYLFSEDDDRQISQGDNDLLLDAEKLTVKQLNSTTYVAYRRAVSKVPALQELRRLFIGRVIHNSPEQWKEAVTQLLKSNVNAV